MEHKIPTFKIIRTDGIYCGQQCPQQYFSEEEGCCMCRLPDWDDRLRRESPKGGPGYFNYLRLSECLELVGEE
jgi:hypothetical protein